MRRFRYLTVTGTLALALLATGCGKREISAEQRAKAAAKKEAQTGMSAARQEYKAKVQEQPTSADARFKLGSVLLAERDLKEAVIELKHALVLGHPKDEVFPVLAEALVLGGEYKQLADEYGSVKLTDSAAQAALMAWRAYAKAAQGDIAGAGKTVDDALAVDPKSATAMIVKARLAGMRNDLQAGIATLDVLLAQDPKSDAAWVLKGELLQRLPDGAKPAMQAFEQALKLQPKNVQAMSALVAQHMAQGSLDSMRAQLAALKQQAPDEANTYYVEAHVSYATGDHARARELFQSLLRVMPENVNVLLSAGENEMKLDASLQAEALFAKALALAPDNSIARRLLAQAQIKLGQATRALATLSPLVDRPDASADALFLAAGARMANGEAKAAEALYARLAKLKPADPQLRTAIAAAGFGKQSDESVLKELRQISEADHGISADMAIIQAFQRKGQFDQALAATAVLSRKRPKDPMVPHLRGRLQLLQKDAGAARESFGQALAMNATYLPAIVALSTMDLEAKQPDSARKRFDHLLKAQPANPTALLALATISASQGAPRDKVLADLKQAVAKAPADVSVRMALITHHLNGGETEPALNAAQAAIAASPNSVELLDMLARCQVLAKQTQQAVSTYGKMMNLDAKSPHPHLGIIDAYLANKDLESAQRATNRLLEMQPDLPAGLARSALIAARKNQPAAALALARRLQALPGSANEGLLLEGQIEIGRGNWDAAAAALRTSVDKHASATGALLYYTALTRGAKVAAAKKFAVDWLRANPRDTSFLFNLGTVDELSQDVAAAEKRYREVLEIDPNHPAALNNLAMLLVQQKKSGAVELAERAVAHAQDKATFLDTLAHAYAASGELDKAVAAQTQAVALAPSEHGWRLSLAKLLLQSGNKPAAKAELDKLMVAGGAFAQQSEVTALRDSLKSLSRQ